MILIHVGVSEPLPSGISFPRQRKVVQRTMSIGKNDQQKVDVVVNFCRASERSEKEDENSSRISNKNYTGRIVVTLFFKIRTE